MLPVRIAADPIPGVLIAQMPHIGLVLTAADKAKNGLSPPMAAVPLCHARRGREELFVANAGLAEDLQGRRCPSRARQRQAGVTDGEAPLMHLHKDVQDLPIGVCVQVDMQHRPRSLRKRVLGNHLLHLLARQRDFSVAHASTPGNPQSNAFFRGGLRQDVVVAKLVEIQIARKDSVSRHGVLPTMA